MIQRGHFRCWLPAGGSKQRNKKKEEEEEEEERGGEEKKSKREEGEQASHLLPSLKLAASIVDEQEQQNLKLRQATTDNIAPQLLNNKLEGRRKFSPLKLILKRIILALASFKLTSSSGTTTTSTTTTTASSTGLSATLNSVVSVLLKTLLIGCYYLIAFSSLLLIILYIINCQVSRPATSPTAGLTRNSSQQKLAAGTPSQMMMSYRQRGELTNQLTRIKRSLVGNEQQHNNGQFRKQPRNQSIKLPPPASYYNRNKRPTTGSAPLPASANRPPPSRLLASNRNKTAASSDEPLTERHAPLNYSANNRGAPTAEALAMSASQSDHRQGQWVPIVRPAGRQLYRKPPPPPVPVRKPPIAAATSLEPLEAAYLPLEEPRASGQRANFRPQPTVIRHWRRPRLQSPLMPEMGSKMYKRVLLCDKTLVSLDYVRNLGPEPRPMDHFDDNDFNGLDNENVLDLESRLHPLLSDRLSPGATSGQSGNQSGNTFNSMIVAESFNNFDILATTGSEQQNNLDRRYSFLTDEDPLVKCDMWDLEKGLKNRKPPPELLRQAVRADFDTVRDAINRCRQLSEKTLPNDDDNQFRDGLEIMSTEDLVSLFSIKRGLIPGTKWCGLGDIAHSYNDLGPKHRIDICCRAHDHCPIRLKPFRNDYGVLNIALYTKSHCDCDADFYRCLREVHSRTADMLGNLYFNVMKLQCMKEERMKICREVKPLALGFEKCVRYEDSPFKRVFRFTTPPVAY